MLWFDLPSPPHVPLLFGHSNQKHGVTFILGESLWQQVDANLFVSLLANNKLSSLSEKYGYQSSLICHNRGEEKLNEISRPQFPYSTPTAAARAKGLVGNLKNACFSLSGIGIQLRNCTARFFFSFNIKTLSSCVEESHCRIQLLHFSLFRNSKLLNDGIPFFHRPSVSTCTRALNPALKLGRRCCLVFCISSSEGSAGLYYCAHSDLL